VDAARGNYALKSDAEVFRQIPGFKPIPFEKIGLFQDEYRTRLPADQEVGRRHGGQGTGAQTDKNFGT
jgi:hypothetical protein